MTGPISSSRASGASAVGLGGAGPRGGAAGKALSNIAANVASAITAELQLAVDPDGRQRGSAQDAYEVEAAADEMVDTLGGNAADRAAAARSLHSFAQEVASLIAARPGSRSLDRIYQIVQRASASQQAQDINAALKLIDATTAEIVK